MKSNLKIFSVGLLTILSLGVLAGCENTNKPSEKESEPSTSSHVDKDNYDFTYNFNYEGGRVTTVQVAAGTRASNMKATRSGYSFTGWYLEKTCENLFDFSQYINDDWIVYAGWHKDAEKVDITFDFNYEGCADPVTVTIDENSTISTSYIPENSRLGFEYDGWYKEPECLNEWYFASDLVQGPMTLYAKYKLDSSLPRDINGNIDYTGVSIDVFYTSVFAVGSRLENYRTGFKSETGITVNISTSISSQDIYSLRMQQTPGMNATYGTYYNARDVLNLAGVTLADDEFYPGIIREAKVNGTLYTIPYGVAPNYVIYNKALMEKYNGENELPSTYEEFTALAKKVIEGETNVNGAVVQSDWPWREAASMAPFAQNNADYYSYDKTNGYTTIWSTDEGKANARVALDRFFDWFNPNGEYKGNYTLAWNDSGTIDAVNNGTALFGVCSQKNVTEFNNHANIGVLPMNGFFGSTNAITCHPLGFSFYKAKNVSLLQLAASAKFVEYVISHSADIVKYGCVPSHKAEFENSSSLNANAKILKSVVPNGDYIWNLPGHVSEKTLFNSEIAENELLANVLADGDKSDLDMYVDFIYDKIVSTIGIL